MANNLVKPLGIGSKIGSAAATKNSRAGLAATPDLIKFATIKEDMKAVQKERRSYLGTKRKIY